MILILFLSLSFSLSFRTVHDEKMRSFFSNDFTQDRWRRAALKNAFALLSKQRFDHAAAFFLLGGKLWDAIDVCVNRLNDMKLAVFIARLYEGENGACYQRLLKEHILGETTAGIVELLVVGLAACNAWARAKHFGCHSVIHSVCYPGMPL